MLKKMALVFIATLAVFAALATVNPPVAAASGSNCIKVTVYGEPGSICCALNDRPPFTCICVECSQFGCTFPDPNQYRYLCPS